MANMARLKQAMNAISRRATREWPDGEPFARVLQHGSMSVEVFAPRYVDCQTPHEQDELYFVQSGQATLVLGDQPTELEAGDAIFVPAGAVHRFERISPDFVTWAVFWGPSGGESGTAD